MQVTDHHYCVLLNIVIYQSANAHTFTYIDKLAMRLTFVVNTETFVSHFTSQRSALFQIDALFFSPLRFVRLYFVCLMTRCRDELQPRSQNAKCYNLLEVFFFACEHCFY